MTPHFLNWFEVKAAQAAPYQKMKPETRELVRGTAWMGWMARNAEVSQLEARVQELEILQSDLHEELAGAYILASGKKRHLSSCSTSCAPAYKPGPCDCDSEAHAGAGGEQV